MSIGNANWLNGSKKLGIIGLIIIAVLVLVIFQPALKGGFYGDDFWQVGRTARLDPVQYLTNYFNPTVQDTWYRPMHGVLLLLDYTLFGANADGYHLVQILLHLINCLLLYTIVQRLSRQWQLAFVSAMLYTGLAPGSWAVDWITVHDPLAVVFQLGTVLLWVIYLQTHSKWYYVFTLVGLLTCFLSKESSATLPVTLFLIDRLLVGERIGSIDLARRYLSIGLALFAYLLLEVEVQSHGYFPNRVGYGFGIHILENLFHYLGLLMFPWGLTQLASYLWFFTALLLFIITVQKQDRKLTIRVGLFLVIQIMLTLAPILGFQPSMFEPRYLYSTSIVSAVLLAIAIEGAWTRLPKTRLYHLSLSTAVVLLLFLQSSSTAQSANDMAESSRQNRLPLHDITQAHPTYPPDTYLYFLDHCQQRITSGMFFLHYGASVTVLCSDVEMGGVEWGSIAENRFAGLRDHKNSFVYYYDDAQQRHEVSVDPKADSNVTPSLPVEFQAPIRLEGYELTSTTLKRGSEFVLLLYWTSQEPIDKDYTVFVHLVDQNGRIIAGQDSIPREGLAPTTSWKKDSLIADGHPLSIPLDAPFSSQYRLEIGWYYPPTMERSSIIESTGQILTDTIVIEPFTVGE